MEHVTLMDVSSPKASKKTINALIDTYDGFEDTVKSIADEAKALAEASDTKAASAESTAAEAYNLANIATNDASTAKINAEEALTAASNAATSASNAETSATAAQTSAASAETSASSAQADAASAQASAASAEASASSASADASSAATSASTAETAATTAQAQVQTAQEAATTAQAQVQTAQTAASNAEAYAEEIKEYAANIDEQVGYTNTALDEINMGSTGTPTPAPLDNPMTALGDLIVGATAGAPARLPMGVANQVLKVKEDQTGLEWVNASAITTAKYIHYITITKTEYASGTTDVSTFAQFTFAIASTQATAMTFAQLCTYLDDALATSTFKYIPGTGIKYDVATQTFTTQYYGIMCGNGSQLQLLKNAINIVGMSAQLEYDSLSTATLNDIVI